MTRDPHLSDHDILLAMDGELPPSQAALAQSHLLHCWRCRTRRVELEQAVAAVVQIHRQDFDSQIPPQTGPAARLRAALAHETATSEKPRWPSNWRRALIPAAAAGMVLIVTAVALVWTSTRSAHARSLPDSRLTPGATRLISSQQVCVVPDNDDDRPVPVELATRVFRDYGIREPRPKAYEVDYLITPALGGAADIRNLWPQPYTEGVWTARVKDALEDYLHTLVCEGNLDLATAQQEIATDWIAAYQKHFHTKRPLPAHALFIKDRPWE